ncbi:MAG: MCE family protein [Rikenellaceae bacterium]|nr:MCE family protein [Rikenellaceae bacterium]
MKKEVKIGIYAIVIILAAWAGIRFLSGADIFGRNRTYTAHYEQVNGLQEAAAVVLRGVKIGQVTDIEINTEKGGVDVRMSVDSHYDIPVNSQAMMFSAGLMGGKSIEIVLGDAAEMLKNGDTIEGGSTPDMFEAIGSELGDIKVRVTALLDNLNNTVTGVDSLIDDNAKNITAAISNLQKIMADLERSNIVANVDGICASLNNTMPKIEGMVTDLQSVTASLRENESGKKLATAITEVNALLAKLNSGNGTVGKLVADEKLYTQLAEASQNLSALLADLKENPSRYINIKVFEKRSYAEKMADKEAKKEYKAKKKADK